VTDTLELRANRMDLVARWADDLAHEIKNPVHAMVINLELVKRRADSGDTAGLVERVEVVEAELHRVHSLIESLLRLVRPWADHGLATVESVFDDMLPVLHARARIRKIHFEHRPGGGTVPLAPDALSLIVLNMVDRAIETTPEDGRILTGCEATADRVRITFRDTGVGPRAAAAAPDRGPADEPRRAGVGLAIARRLVQEAGGDLLLETATGGPGTVATIDLPRADTA
jgi:two-component system, sporulation sensor kinase E